jgi:hypothetical protein
MGLDHRHIGGKTAPEHTDDHKTGGRATRQLQGGQYGHPLSVPARRDFGNAQKTGGGVGAAKSSKLGLFNWPDSPYTRDFIGPDTLGGWP